MAGTFGNFFVIYIMVLVGFGTAYLGLLVEVGNFNLGRNIFGIFYFTYFQVKQVVKIRKINDNMIDIMNLSDAIFRAWESCFWKISKHQAPII